MHDVLRIAEVFHVICQFATRDTLAKLARTCRTFEDPALDALWKNLETLEPLVQCLPSDIWGGLGEKTILRRPLCADHQRLLQKYSSRICCIHKGTFYGTRLNNLIVLASSRGVPLFPNLKILLSCRVTDDRISLFRWLISPSLVQLQLSIESTSLLVLEFIASLARSCPMVETVALDLVNSVDTDAVAGSLSQSICQWNHLAHASLCSLDVSAYEHISLLRSLTYLKLSISRAAPVQLAKAELPPTAFMSVRDLVLDAESFLVATVWLDCLSQKHPVSLCLSHLTVNIRQCKYVSGSIHGLCQAIQSLVSSHDTLQSIELDDLRCQYGIFFNDVNVIRPLLRFRNLRRVIIHELAAIMLDDEELAALANAWPLIEVLHLNRYVANQEVPRGRSVVLPSFWGLCTLARLCPHLRELSVVADLTRARTGSLDIRCPSVSIRHTFTSGDIGRFPDDWVSNHLLSSLVLGNSPLDDPKFVASIIGDIFPFLSHVSLEDWDFLPLYEASEFDEGETLESWKKVNEYMEDFAVVRAQERRRAAS